MSHPAWVCGLKPQLVTTRPRKDVSHPAWVCGLKLIGRGANDATTSSHPAWVCGLKHPFRELLNGCNSHTLRGCVDWNPFKTTSPIAISCHTLRGCVDWNNREIAIRCDRRRVTPCVGVWIETNVQAAPVGPLIVTPCVGVYGLKHCSLVGQVYGRIVSIRPLVYFSSSCYKVKSQTKYVRLLTLLWLEKTRTIPDAYLLSVFFCGFT